MMKKELDYFHDINNKLTMIHGKFYKVKKLASPEQLAELEKMELWCNESFDLLKEFRDFIIAKEKTSSK